LGCCSAYIAELWGVFEGLKIASSCGIQKLDLHVDSSAVVSTITSTKGGSAEAWSLLQNIRKLLGLNWEVRIRHSYREANASADALANMACEGGFFFILYEHCLFILVC